MKSSLHSICASDENKDITRPWVEMWNKDAEQTSENSVMIAAAILFGSYRIPDVSWDVDTGNILDNAAQFLLASQEACGAWRNADWIKRAITCKGRSNCVALGGAIV